MEIEATIVEKKTGKIRNWVRRHKGLLIAGGIAAAGTILMVVLARNNSENGVEPIVTKTVTNENGIAAKEEPTEEYDVWAMCNGEDQKVVEFAPKLEEFAKENDIKMMCEVI
jgi:hypothetical protein